MKTYNIAWEIQIEANNPLDAAEKALEIMQDLDSCARQFYVQAVGENEISSVDLEEPEGSEVLTVDEYSSIIKN